jgi:hypothetical protein
MEIISAEQFALKNMQSTDMQEIERCLIAFAKYHVELCKKEMLKKVRFFNCVEGRNFKSYKGELVGLTVIDDKSIKNAYSLDHIK